MTGLAGELLVHFNRTKSLQPTSLAVLTACSNSASVAIPEDIINVLPVEVDESTDVPDGSLINGEAVGWPVIKATNSFNTFVYIAYHQFNIVPVLA